MKVRTVTWRALTYVARSPTSRFFLLVNPEGSVWPGFIGTIHSPIYAGFYGR